MTLAAYLRRPFETRQIFLPVTLGYLTGCVLTVHLIYFVPLFFSKDSPSSLSDWLLLFQVSVLPMIFGSPGYLAALFVFRAARRKGWKIRSILMTGTGIGAVMGLILSSFVIFDSASPNWIAILSTVTALFTGSALVCVLCMLGFFSLFDNIHDKRHRPAIAVE